MTNPHPRTSSTPVLVGTGGYYALAASEDPNHDEALAIIGTLAHGQSRLHTTHLILAELHTLLRSRLKQRGRDYALTVARDTVAGILQSTVTVEPITAADAQQAVQTLFAYPNQELSYTDATSFAVMRRLGIAHVLAFDDDFAVAGFTIIRHVVR